MFVCPPPMVTVTDRVLVASNKITLKKLLYRKMKIRCLDHLHLTKNSSEIIKFKIFKNNQT